MKLVVTGLALSLTLASSASSHPVKIVVQQTMADLVYGATQKMVAGLPPYVKRDRPIIVTTIVDVNDFTKSSTLGRESSQLILNRLSQDHYLVRDVTFMHALEIKPETGEMVLSRDAQRLSHDMGAQAVVVGTYAVGGQYIYLNFRMLDAATGSAVGSADVVIPRDSDTAPMVEAQR
jgi:hypothetical protein